MNLNSRFEIIEWRKREHCLDGNMNRVMQLKLIELYVCTGNVRADAIGKPETWEREFLWEKVEDESQLSVDLEDWAIELEICTKGRREPLTKLICGEYFMRWGREAVVTWNGFSTNHMKGSESNCKTGKSQMKQIWRKNNIGR